MPERATTATAGWRCKYDEVVVPKGKVCPWCGRGCPPKVARSERLDDAVDLLREIADYIDPRVERYADLRLRINALVESHIGSPRGSDR